MVTLARARGLAMVIVVGACQRETAEPPAPSKPAVAALPAPDITPAPDVTPIVGKAGPLELVADDGTDHEALSFARFKQLYAGYNAKHPDDQLVVVAEHFPPGITAAAWLGINLITQDAAGNGRNVSWLVDGDAAHGYTLIYDENTNGDLRDDPRHAFTRQGDALEITIRSALRDRDSHVSWPTEQRLRVRGGKLFIQDQLIRRGAITVDGKPRPFVLVANGGDFHFPAAQVVLDVDGDGVAGPFTDPAHETPESFYVFEHTLNVGARSFDFAIDPGGDALALTPRATPLPARPSLAVGSPAPELAGTDLDGEAVALSGLRGKTVLVDFWSPWCGPCRQAMPKLADLYKRRHGEGLDILSIVDGERDDVVKLLGAKPYPGHEVLDSKNLGLSYRVIGYPSYFIVDREGKIACARCDLARVLATLDRAPAGS